MKSDLIFKQAFTSSSAILSSVTGEIRKWWISHFPEDFFNYIHIDSGIPSVQNIEGNADRMREYRKSNPALAIKPKLRFQEDLIGEALKNPAPFRYENLGPDSHFYTLYRNDQFLQSITFLIDYWKIDFTIGIRVETEVQALDIIGILNKRMFPDNFFYLQNSPVLVQVPFQILSKTSSDLGLDIRLEDDLKLFLDILQHNSAFPIDIKIKRDSGKRIIAFIIPVNILCKLEKISEPDIGKIGRSQENTKIIINMSAQIPFPNLFKVRTEFPAPPPALTDIKDCDKSLIETDSGNKGEVLINYVLTVEPPQFIPGTQAKRIFMKKFLTSQDEEVDHLSLTGLMPPPLELFINQMMSEGKQDILEEAIILRLYRDDYCEDPSDYKFNFATRELEIFSPLRNYIYRVVVYAELTVIKKYDALIKGIPDLSQVFDSDILQ